MDEQAGLIGTPTLFPPRNNQTIILTWERKPEAYHGRGFGGAEGVLAKPREDVNLAESGRTFGGAIDQRLVSYRRRKPLCPAVEAAGLVGAQTAAN